MYARRLKDRLLDFNHRGWLYEDSFTFYDYETDSLWVQATGEAIAGPLKGTRLERLPSMQSTWSEWRALHPDTLVLARVLDRNSKYWDDPYKLNYAAGRGIKYVRDKPVSFGMAVILPAEQKLYPFAELGKKPVLLDSVGRESVVVVFHPPSKTGAAFDAKSNGQLLEFAEKETQQTDVLLTDRQTQSTWSGLTGRCLAGPARGTQLRQLTTTHFVVENWPLHYPRGTVYLAP